MEIFAKRLRQVREENKESREDLGKVLGVSVSQISEMENGRKGTTLERLVALCKHYKVSADYLLGLTDIQEVPIWLSRPERDLVENFRTLNRDQKELIVKNIVIMLEQNRRE